MRGSTVNQSTDPDQAWLVGLEYTAAPANATASDQLRDPISLELDPYAGQDRNAPGRFYLPPNTSIDGHAAYRYPATGSATALPVYDVDGVNINCNADRSAGQGR
jgi:hypothetical protein